jgi:hypothetical protein
LTALVDKGSAMKVKIFRSQLSPLSFAFSRGVHPPADKWKPVGTYEVGEHQVGLSSRETIAVEPSGDGVVFVISDSQINMIRQVIPIFAR